MLKVSVLLLAMLAAGCAHRPPKVSCDAHLQPINVPASHQADNREHQP